MKYLLSLFALLTFFVATAQTYSDQPYIQDYADKYNFKKSNDAALLQVRSDRNGIIQVLSRKGLLNPWQGELEADIRYRPITDMKLIALETYKNQFVYLTDKAVLSNAWAGKFYIEHKLANPIQFAIGDDFTTLVASSSELVLFKEGKKVFNKSLDQLNIVDIIYDKEADRFLLLSTKSVYEFLVKDNSFKTVYSAKNLTAITLFNDELIVGTSNGIITLDASSFKTGVINQKLPSNQITSLTTVDNALWAGSIKGAFKYRSDGKYDYYASKRWLVDDVVVDIAAGPDKSVLVLTSTGLSKINFVSMTLAEKAAHFQEVQRLRHVRYGFSSETNLEIPGDLSTSYLHDTDNDGLWTSMYLAGELFRYAVTKSEDAKQNMYEAFEAMERLTEITGLDGFPARTYEVDGYISGRGSNGISKEEQIEWEKKNGELWRLTDDGRWRWKSSTSSDESCGHFFVYDLFAQIAPDSSWRARAIHQIKIEMDHIMRNDWYLVTWNGKPTMWGKWNPDYVNSFPDNVGDKRLNSTLILSFLQITYKYTGDEKYKKAAQKLIDKYGYDENANRLASEIGFEEGEDLSDRWNHSDDEMYFLTAPGFVNHSFSSSQKEAHFKTVKSHWQEERSEKNPLWNYLYAMVGGVDYDAKESIWWLKEFPMDLIDWDIDNAQRKDLVTVEPNFRGQEYTEVLPQDERVLHLHNGAYRNSGGSAGIREYPPYIYLLPYWAGRYVGAIDKVE